MHKINYIQTNIQHICNIGPWYSEKTKERRTTGRNPQGICYWGYLILGVIGKPFLWHDFLKNWELEELVFKYTLISLLSELDGLLWNNTSLGSIYTFNSTSDYDSKKHPFGAAGTVEVKRFGGSSTIQILYDINNHVFLRRKVGEEAWNAWTQV